MDINKNSMVEYEAQDFIQLMNKLKKLIKNEERLEDSPESLKEIYDGIETPFFEVSLKIRMPETEIEKSIFNNGVIDFEIYNKYSQSNPIAYCFNVSPEIQTYFSSFYDVLMEAEVLVLKKYPIKLIIDNYEIIDKNTFSKVFDSRENITLEDCIKYAEFVNKITDFSYMQSHDMNQKAMAISRFENSMNRVGLNREILSDILGYEVQEKSNFIYEYSTARILVNLSEDDKYMLMLNGILPE